MIDFHTHILPEIDDGSQSFEESISMLTQLAEQGIMTVVATPHFSANNEESVDAFVKKRNDAFEQLKPSLSKALPDIRLGAEVAYYSGISRMEEIEKLCIEGTKTLLLEMPMSRWTEYVVNELVEIVNCRGLILVIAHIERYMGFQKNETMQRLYENGVLMQSNATFFLKRLTRRKALTMLKNEEINILGSDCHNTSSRPPNIGKAYVLIRNKLGENLISQVNELGIFLLNK